MTGQWIDDKTYWEDPKDKPAFALGDVADDSNLAEPSSFAWPRDNRSSEATLSYVSLRGRGGAGDRPDVGEHAAGVPSWKFSYE